MAGMNKNWLGVHVCGFRYSTTTFDGVQRGLVGSSDILCILAFIARLATSAVYAEKTACVQFHVLLLHLHLLLSRGVLHGYVIQ